MPSMSIGVLREIASIASGLATGISQSEPASSAASIVRHSSRMIRSPSISSPCTIGETPIRGPRRAPVIVRTGIESA
jgi:hypothetical protein